MNSMGVVNNMGDIVKHLGPAHVWRCTMCGEQYVGVADRAMQQWRAFHIVHRQSNSGKWYVP